MPRLWSQTIEEHRKDVRSAILDTTSRLVHERGLLAVTMSRIAEETGIGRATLYKYFPDVEAILLEWHRREVAAHLDQLAQVRDRADASSRLGAVLEAYALMRRKVHRHDGELSALLHKDPQLAAARRRVRDLLADVLADAAEMGSVRGDVTPHELANYCVHALEGASRVSSKAAVGRLVALTMAGLRGS